MKRALILTAVALLAAPAAASAKTITVAPGQKIADALSQAADGDTIHVLPGSYAEQPLTVDHAVRIEGEPGAIVSNASPDASKALFTITADGVTLASIGAASSAGPVVAGQGANLALDGALVASAAGPGPGLLLTPSGATTIVRSAIAAVAPGTDAVQVQSATVGAKSLSIDSSILSGGASAASLDVTSSNSLLVPNTGNVVVNAVHATIAGASTAIATTVTPVTPSVIGTPGTITVSADRSILRGTTSPGVTVTDSDTSAADIFVASGARNYHLRADAPVIDKGGAVGPGESDRDVDGQPRVTGAASDLGADEFVNQAPVARLATPDPVRTPAAVTLDASASSDPEAGWGGGIAGYHFDFGDGSTADSATPVVTHTYARPGAYAATVTATDAQGLTGTAGDAVQVRVVDGIAPSARIISPRNGRKLRRRSTIRFTGSASDDIAVAGVALTLRRIGSKQPSNIKVRLQQGIWTYKVPKRLKRRRGHYELKAYAVDTAGNVSKAARVRFTLK